MKYAKTSVESRFIFTSYLAKIARRLAGCFGLIGCEVLAKDAFVVKENEKYKSSMLRAQNAALEKLARYIGAALLLTNTATRLFRYRLRILLELWRIGGARYVSTGLSWLNIWVGC